MNSKLSWVGVMLLGITLASGTALAQVTVPNTFLPNTPAYAADVNENFTTLANAINGISGGALAPVSGYGTPYAATDVLNARNVIVLRRGTAGVNLTYFVIAYYTGSASSQIAVDGTTPTTFTYIEEYISIGMDIDDTTVIFASGTRRGTNDAPGAAVRTWYAENQTWDLLTGAPIGATIAAPAKFQRIQNAVRYFNVLNPDTEVGFPNSTSTNPSRIRDHSRTFLANPTALNINGIPFPDTVIMLEFGTTRKFILAKNIGIVWWDLQGSTTGSIPDNMNKVVYYYVNGSTGGTLPAVFDAGGVFQDLF